MSKKEWSSPRTGKSYSTRNSLGNPKWAAKRLEVGPFLQKPILCSGSFHPSPWSGLVSRATRNWRKEGGFTADDFPGTQARTQTRTHLGSRRAALTPTSAPEAHLPPTPGRISFAIPTEASPAHPPFPICTALRRVAPLTSPRVGLRARARDCAFPRSPVPTVRGRAGGRRRAEGVWGWRPEPG